MADLMASIDKSQLSIAFTHRVLCTRCGTCVAACPTNAISLDKELYPVLNPQACTECGLCARVCPGGRVSFHDLNQLVFGRPDDAGSFDGHLQSTYVGYAADPRIRRAGSGGGVITALLWDLLSREQVDGCIVTRMYPQKPWQGQVYIARNYQELLQSQQSKYIIIPVNAILQHIKSLKGKYAIVALPCQIHGLRLLMREEKPLARKIHVILGLFCASSLQPFVAAEMLSCRGIQKRAIKDFQFRGGEWPGKIRAVLKNGQIKHLHYSNFKDGAINYLTYLYSPERCQTCIDGSAEFADIAVSDAWTRDEYGNYLFNSHSKLIVRTDKGVAVMTDVIAAGNLIADDVTRNGSYQTHKLHTQKKGLKAPLRVARLLREGKVAPIYDRSAPAASWRESWGERMESAIMRLGRSRATRWPLFNFLTSRYGIIFVKIRQFIKSRKYRKK
ncbi:Coenzyme F420 hydrogenase/dehydrogenase, beta subunit C-terminal domain [candidate division KSB1 bacterium]|nr:Coenzyme F420 hydrogenase/dehydrogenase, beta subunit C-terminal domain [candidate division KSB1 bacterium]